SSQPQVAQPQQQAEAHPTSFVGSTQAPARQTPPLQTPAGPPSKGPNPFSQSMSAGAAIEQAARAAAATRGTFGGGGAGGDYGLGTGARGKIQSNLEILSDTMGVDFGPYLSRIVHNVRINWYNLIPEVARPPLLKKGKVSIEFAIIKNGG